MWGRDGQVGVEPAAFRSGKGFGIARPRRRGAWARLWCRIAISGCRQTASLKAQGLFDLTLVEQRYAEVGVHSKDMRVKRDALAEVCDRLFGAAQLPEDHAEVIVHRDRIGPDLQGMPERFGTASSAPAHLLKGEAQRVRASGSSVQSFNAIRSIRSPAFPSPRLRKCLPKIDMAERRQARPQRYRLAEQIGSD